MMLPLLQRLRRMAEGSGIGRLPGVAPLYRTLLGGVRPHGITVIRTKDFPLFINADGGGLHQILLEQGVYEADTGELMRALLKPGMTMVDIGSNIGYFSVLCAKAVGPTGRIVCFEPAPENVSLLKRNVELNSLQDRVTVVAQCVSDTQGNLTLHLDTTNQGNHSLAAGNVVQEKASVTVPCTTLDMYTAANPLQRIDLLKMDVQGAELHVLRGATKTLAEHPEMKMIIEFWPFGLRNAGSNPEEILQILRSAGYHFIDTEYLKEPIDQLSNADLVKRCDAKRSGRGWMNLLVFRNV